MQEIRILLVDDHSLFRESLSRLLQTAADFRVVGEYATVAEAIAALSVTKADVILLDYDLGEEQGSRLFAPQECPIRLLCKSWRLELLESSQSIAVSINWSLQSIALQMARSGLTQEPFRLLSQEETRRLRVLSARAR